MKTQCVLFFKLPIFYLMMHLFPFSFQYSRRHFITASPHFPTYFFLLFCYVKRVYTLIKLFHFKCNCYFLRTIAVIPCVLAPGCLLGPFGPCGPGGIGGLLGPCGAGGLYGPCGPGQPGGVGGPCGPISTLFPETGMNITFEMFDMTIPSPYNRFYFMPLLQVRHNYLCKQMIILFLM